MDYNKELEKMYNEKYYCNNGVCSFYEDCKKRRNLDFISFRQDRVRVGKNYGNGVPNILFVGIEGFPDKEWQDKNHIVLGHHEPSKNADNPHYNGVKFILEYLLNSDKKPILSIAHKICEKYNDKTDKFALTNLYKCAFPNKSEDQKRGLPHTKAMQRNCQKILIDEIKVMDPDILIIQASDSNWPEGLSDRLNTEFNLSKIYGDWQKDKIELLKGKFQKELLVLCTLHGASSTYITKNYLSKLAQALDKVLIELK